MKRLWRILKRTVTEFFEDDAMRLSAALAYYSVFSLAPLLLICVAVAGAVFGEDAVRGQLDDQLTSAVGEQGAHAVREMLANAHRPAAGIWASIIGGTVLLFGAGGVFGQLQDALNVVWGVKAKKGLRLWDLARDRFLSFTMVLGAGFLLLISMVLSVAFHVANRWVERIAKLPPEVWSTMTGVAGFLLVALLFAAIFKILPDVEVKWRHVWMGALLTALLFSIGQSLISWYLGREAIASSYGTAGSLALVLLWVHYSAIILLFGAEFTQVWAVEHGEEIRPVRNAERKTRTDGQ
ncbi:MAG: YihY/virulence factor BrkB family protein [Luteolibacter sp.]